MSSKSNKKGQVGVLGILAGLIMFWILWAIVLGNLVNTWSNSLITEGSLTGIEAFLASNINLWIILGVHFSALAAAYFGS